MKNKKLNVILMSALVCSQLMVGCGTGNESVEETVTATSSVEATTETTEAAQTESQTEASDQVASASDMAEVKAVVTEDMVPITADQLKDGEYDVEVESSSSMFNITACKLTVAEGNMTAVMTMGGTGYLYLYMGTGEQASTATEDTYIPFVEIASGEHTFEVPVEALDSAIDCAAFSKKKEKWYDRQIAFLSAALPEEAFIEGRPVAVTSNDAMEQITLEDGQYDVNVTLEGGSGRASVESPATITVTDGKAMATIIWSSSNYDYMLVDGEKYINESTDGNSTFTIPVLGFQYQMPVIADTTAMGTPHEIEYTLFFELAE